MGAGERHFRLAFDEPVDLSDGQGGAEEGWAEIWSCHAKVRFLKGGEPVQQARLQGVRPVVISVVNCSEARLLDEHFRVRDVRNGSFAGDGRWVGTLGDIVSIAPTDDRHEYEIMAVLTEAK